MDRGVRDGTDQERRLARELVKAKASADAESDCSEPRYTSSGFPVVLRRCLRECARALGHTEDRARDEDIFERALL